MDDGMNERLRELEQANRRLAAALREAQAETPQQQASAGERLMRAEVERDALAAEVARLNEHVANLERAERALVATQASLSWRVTRPLRAVKARLRR